MCGLCNEATQRKLLSEADLTFQLAVEITEGMEAAERNTKLWKGNGDAPIQRVTPSQSCYQCGATNHLPGECRFRDEVCHACKKRGYIAKVCRSKKSDSPHRKQQAGRQKKIYQPSSLDTRELRLIRLLWTLL